MVFGQSGPISLNSTPLKNICFDIKIIKIQQLEVILQVFDDTLLYNSQYAS